MVYLLDTCVLRELLNHFPKQGTYFVKVWQKIEGLIGSEIFSVDECYNELEKQFDRFGFGFSRMLLALGYISFDTFCKTWITKCLPPPKEGCVSIRNEKQINFTENFTFCTLRHRSKWIENELNTKFLCLLAKQNDLPYLTVDLDGKCSKEYLEQLSKYFLSQQIDHPILCSGIAFIPDIAYAQIISWNELPRIVSSDKYSLWDNFEKVNQGTIKNITDSPCLKD